MSCRKSACVMVLDNAEFTLDVLELELLEDELELLLVPVLLPVML
ncbi:hypothetical protein [Dyella sp. C9]|nr:hypothetical protein [Dyella sp. C9]